jgi:hypothetical protein
MSELPGQSGHALPLRLESVRANLPTHAPQQNCSSTITSSAETQRFRRLPSVSLKDEAAGGQASVVSSSRRSTCRASSRHRRAISCKPSLASESGALGLLLCLCGMLPVAFGFCHG